MRIYSVALTISAAAARLVNITIDDTYGDPRTGQIPQYKSDVPWKGRSAGDGCAPAECSAQLDGKRVHNGTWHDKLTVPTAPPANVTMTFNGTKVYVFCVLVNNIGISIQDTRLQFRVDGALADSFFHKADLTTDVYLYDQLVFQSQPLPLDDHKLEIVNTATPDQFHGSLVLFDYVIYTTEEDDPGSSSTLSAIGSASTTPLSTSRASQKPTNLGAAVGGALGGAAVVAAALLFGICAFARLRRRNRATALSAQEAGNVQHRGDLDRFAEQAHISPFLAGASAPKRQPRSDIADTGASVLKSEDPTESVRASTAANGDELRREMEIIRSEVEILKQAVGPPHYTAPSSKPNVSLQR